MTRTIVEGVVVVAGIGFLLSVSGVSRALFCWPMGLLLWGTDRRYRQLREELWSGHQILAGVDWRGRPLHEMRSRLEEWVSWLMGDLRRLQRLVLVVLPAALAVWLFLGWQLLRVLEGLR